MRMALTFQQRVEALTLPIQERIGDLKHAVSLIKLDSDMAKVDTWDSLVKAVDDFNERFLKIVPKGRREPTAVEEMRKELECIRKLYDQLFEAMRKELEELERDLPLPEPPRQRLFRPYTSLMASGAEK